MEQQILAELTQIKWSLVAIFVSIAITILYHLLTLAFRVRRTNAEAMVSMREGYIAELSLLDSRGEYEELLEKSEEMLRLFPADLLANWYNAVGNYQNRQYAAALSSLGRIKQINGSWSAESVNALMTEVQSAMDGPRATS